MIATAASFVPCSFLFLTQVGSNSLFVKKIKAPCMKQAGMVTAKLELKPPPYALDALEPHMSRNTLEYHWGKHHRAYVDNLNKQTVGTEMGSKTLEDIIVSTYNKGDLLPPFNNAAQAWNHTFFWESMKPGGGGMPSGELLEMINRDFGSFEEFVKEFKTAAATQFGSGWAWLAFEDRCMLSKHKATRCVAQTVLQIDKVNKFSVDSAANPVLVEEDKRLVVVKTPNAVNPLVLDYAPLLTIDIWEHAYYLDYQNRRPDYISVFMETLVSWEAASERLEKAKAYIAEKEAEEKRLRENVENETATDDTEEIYVDGSASEAE